MTARSGRATTSLVSKGLTLEGLEKVKIKCDSCNKKVLPEEAVVESFPLDLDLGDAPQSEVYLILACPSCGEYCGSARETVIVRAAHAVAALRDAHAVAAKARPDDCGEFYLDSCEESADATIEEVERDEIPEWCRGRAPRQTAVRASLGWTLGCGCGCGCERPVKASLVLPLTEFEQGY